MDFILTHKKIKSEWLLKTAGGLYIYYERKNSIPSREIIDETNNYFVIGDANISFVKALSEKKSIQQIENNIHKLRNGFVVFHDKQNDETSIYTDIFGFYHLFYLKTDEFFAFSSDFKLLLEFSEKLPDDFAILDILFFNYTLLDRTTVSDIKRLTGGANVSLVNNDINISFPNNFADNFPTNTSKNRLIKKEFTDILKDSLLQDLSLENKNFLSITGGFDSRALLALCKNMNIDISTFTFGQEGNIEQEIVNTFVHNHTKQHVFYKLDKSYIEKLPTILNDFVSKNLDNPVILDLPQYEHIKQNIDSSNIIAGFLGGELMTGQSIGSQVTFTKEAAVLLSSTNFSDLENNFLNIIKDSDIIQQKYSNKIIADYLHTLNSYFPENNRTNILRFLINESYSKFFGAVNKVFKNHSNLIIPFLNDRFIDYLLNSKISFLNKKPFVKNPFANIRAKVFYAKCIKYLYPPLAETRFDRLYKLNDLCLIYRFPKVIFGYIQSHFLKKNKKEYPRPHHYNLWYKQLVVKELGLGEFVKKNKMIDPNLTLLLDNYDKLSGIQQKKLANITAVNIALNQIFEI